MIELGLPSEQRHPSTCCQAPLYYVCLLVSKVFCSKDLGGRLHKDATAATKLWGRIQILGLFVSSVDPDLWLYSPFPLYLFWSLSFAKSPFLLEECLGPQINLNLQWHVYIFGKISIVLEFTLNYTVLYTIIFRTFASFQNEICLFYYFQSLHLLPLGNQ